MLSMRIRRGDDLGRHVWMRLDPDVRWALVAMGVRQAGDVTLGMLRVMNREER